MKVKLKRKAWKLTKMHKRFPKKTYDVSFIPSIRKFNSTVYKVKKNWKRQRNKRR